MKSDSSFSRPAVHFECPQKKVPLSIASVTFRVQAIVENLGNLLGDQKLLGHFLQVFAKQCYLGHYNSTLANSAMANIASAIMEIDWLKIGKQNIGRCWKNNFWNRNAAGQPNLREQVFLNFKMNFRHNVFYQKVTRKWYTNLKLTDKNPTWQAFGFFLSQNYFCIRKLETP